MSIDVHRDIVSPVAYAFITIWVMIILTVGAYGTLRNYETHWWPVIADFRMEDTEIVGSHLRFRPYMDKLRDCNLVDKAWYVRRPDGNLYQVSIDFPAPLPGSTNAPVGKQVRGWIEVGQNDWPDAVEQQGYFFHDCMGYPVRTKVGPFPIIQ